MPHAISRRLGGVAALALTGITLAACNMGATAPLAAPVPRTGSSTTADPAPPATSSTPPPVVIMERHTALGTVLTTAAGLTLYDYRLDHGGQSACTGACATAWPPLLVPAHAKLTSTQSLPHRLTVITRPDGQQQAVYDGQPLYLFAGDHAPGQTRGQGLKGVWFVAGLNGPISPPPAPAPAPKPVAPAPSMQPPPPAPPAPPRATMPPSHTGIPQGGGDQDGDNFGGPNDGDGNK